MLSSALDDLTHLADVVVHAAGDRLAEPWPGLLDSAIRSASSPSTWSPRTHGVADAEQAILTLVKSRSSYANTGNFCKKLLEAGTSLREAIAMEKNPSPAKPAAPRFANFTGKKRLLLEALDGKGPVKTKELVKVTGSTPTGFPKLVTRTNGELAAKNVPLEIKKSGNAYYLNSI